MQTDTHLFMFTLPQLIPVTAVIPISTLGNACVGKTIQLLAGADVVCTAEELQPLTVHSLVMWPLEQQQQLKPTSPKSQKSLSRRFYLCTLFFLFCLRVKWKHESPSIRPLHRFDIHNYGCKMKKSPNLTQHMPKWWSWSSRNQSYNSHITLSCDVIS